MSTMSAVLEHWEHKDDIYDQPAWGDYSGGAWLPRLGPTSFLLWGVLASQVLYNGSGVTVDLVDVAQRLGLTGTPSSNSGLLARSLKRLRSRRLLKPEGEATRVLRVRLYAPRVSIGAYERLPVDVQELHVEVFGVPTNGQVGIRR